MWNELWNKYRGVSVGIACGLLLGMVYLIFGFWNMLVFAFIVYAGFFVGYKIDRREPLFSWWEIYRWLNERWRMFR